MRPLIIYHAYCTDGYGAAFAAWLKLGDEAEYVPMQYGLAKLHEALPFNPLNRDVYILDFSFERQIMDFIFRDAKRVVWLDHHKTAFEMWGVEPGPFKQFRQDINLGNGVVHHIDLNDNKSGALLAWEYFHPGTEVPMLIQHIDDRDRWQWKLEGSAELHAALSSMKPWSFGQWERKFFLTQKCGDYQAVLDLRTEGTAILRAQKQHVEQMAKQARKCAILKPTPPRFAVNVVDGDIPWVYNRDPSSGYVAEVSGLAVNASIHQSEVGHELANQSGTYGLVWYVAADCRVRCSLRSNGDYDVSSIARSFGGGGHRNAAGFETDIETLMGWLK